MLLRGLFRHLVGMLQSVERSMELVEKLLGNVTVVDCVQSARCCISDAVGHANKALDAWRIDGEQNPKE